VDLILLVSDCSRRGIQAAGRIAEMIDELDLKVKKVGLIVNRAPELAAEAEGRGSSLAGKLNSGITEEIEAQKLSLIGVLPQDPLVFEYDSAGTPLVKLPESSPVRQALGEIIRKLEL
jgi:CO dehydrogenase maturation factor